MLSFTVRAAQYTNGNNAYTAFKPGWMFFDLTDYTQFVVESVTTNGSGNYVVSSRQLNNMQTDGSGGCAANYKSSFAPGGYLAAWNAKVALPKQVEWATFSTSSGVVVPQRQDGTSDAATYLATGDMFCGPAYIKAQAFPIGWPLPQGCYALTLSAGVWSFPVNAAYSGYGPIYPYPIH